MIKECDEEASIPPDLAARAYNAGVVTYYTSSEHGLQPESE